MGSGWSVEGILVKTASAEESSTSSFSTAVVRPILVLRKGMNPGLAEPGLEEGLVRPSIWTQRHEISSQLASFAAHSAVACRTTARTPSNGLDEAAIVSIT